MFPVLNNKIINRLRKLPVISCKDYNYKTGDIILVNTTFYTFKNVTSSGEIHAYDRSGYSTILNSSDVNGSIARDEYPELFL